MSLFPALSIFARIFLLGAELCSLKGRTVLEGNPPSESVQVAWPSGLRRWIKAPVSPGAWVRIPPLPELSFLHFCNLRHVKVIFINDSWPRARALIISDLLDCREERNHQHVHVLTLCTPATRRHWTILAAIESVRLVSAQVLSFW